MISALGATRFSAKAFPSKGFGTSVLERTVAPHPLSFQELPFVSECRLYNKRLTPEFLNYSDV